MKNTDEISMAKPIFSISIVELENDKSSASIMADGPRHKIVAGFVILLLKYPSLYKILKEAIQSYERPVKLPKASDFQA